MVLLDLGPTSLFLGFKFEPLDVVSCLANALACGHQRTVSITLSCLGTYNPLAGLHDTGIKLCRVSVAEGAMQQTAATRVAASVCGASEDAAVVSLAIGRGMVRGGGISCAVGCVRSVRRRRGSGSMPAAEETMTLGRLLDDGWRWGGRLHVVGVATEERHLE